MSLFSGTDLVQSLISHLNYFSKHLLHLPFYSLSPPPCCQSAVSKYKSIFLSSTVRVVCFLRIMVYKSIHYPSLACLPNFLLHYTPHTHTPHHAPPIHNYLCFACNSPSVPCYFFVTMLSHILVSAQHTLIYITDTCRIRSVSSITYSFKPLLNPR